VPAIGGNDAAIGERRVVDDGEDRFGILNRLDYFFASCFSRRWMKTRAPAPIMRPS